MIQSVERAAQILSLLSSGDGGHLGVSELSDRLRLAKGTVHGLLRTLQAHGLVEQDPRSQLYGLGPFVLQLSSSYLDHNQLRQRSLAWSASLATEFRETVRVGEPVDAGVLIVHHIARFESALQLPEVGSVLPAHATALGKAILAFSPQSVVEAVSRVGLPKLTARTITTAAALRRELGAVRDRTFAFELEEAVLAEVGLAAPIFERGGQVIGAIGVVGPRGRLVEEFATLSDPLIEAARGISREFGAPRWPM